MEMPEARVAARDGGLEWRVIQIAQEALECPHVPTRPSD